LSLARRILPACIARLLEKPPQPHYLLDSSVESKAVFRTGDRNQGNSRFWFSKCNMKHDWVTLDQKF